VGSHAVPRRADESGWLIVEVMISAVVLILAGLAIYSGLDGASSASGRNRNRTMAAVLAQQDQERMRSMDTSALAAYIRTPYVQAVDVGGRTYSVTSTVAYVNDSTGASCTSASTLASYLKISSTVADPTNKNKPVTIDSLVSPRADISGAAVQIVDRSGTTGIAGIPVRLDEDSSKDDTTDSLGCVQFGFLKGTSYHVSFSKPGYVDANGQNPQTAQPITVVAGRSTLTQFQYDLAGSITGLFQNSANATVPSGPLMVFNNAMSPTTRSSSSGSVTGLFPFTSAYAVYAGACTSDDPSQWSVAPGSQTLTPGLAATTTVRVPTLTLTIKQQVTTGGRHGGTTTTNLGGADVHLTDSGCGTSYQATANSSGVAVFSVPYGNYAVCADNGNSNGSDKVTDTTTNHVTAGTADSFTVDTSKNNGHC
jgi:Tfp pilus assembly protein PilV